MIRHHKSALIAAVIAIICIISTSVITKVIIQNRNYNSAMSLEENGEYKKAIGAFKMLNGYKDSAEQVLLCETAIKDADYEAAEALKNAGRYDEAIAEFEALNGYRDSADQISDCLILKIEIGDVYTFGKYEQDDDTTNGKEDIEWLVLAKEEGKILLISKYALDCQPYNTAGEDVTWETCSLRKWLNGTFINDAFKSEEQTAIINSIVKADKNPLYNSNPGKDTTDKIFLMSTDEAEKYFSFLDEEMMCAPTEYALSRGAEAPNEIYSKYGRPPCPWWLRTPGYYNELVTYISYNSAIYSEGFVVDEYGFCVRPVLWFDLTYSDFLKSQEDEMNNKFNLALELYETGNYEDAITALEALEGYKDSAEIILLCKIGIKDNQYAIAVELYEAEEYEKAIKALKKLNGYKDSEEMLLLCEMGINDNKYASAVELYKAGEYENAIAAFEELNGYKDSAEQINLCKDNIYAAALEMYEAGKYEDAIATFEELNGYKDSAEQINLCKDNIYAAALAMRDNGDIVGAYESLITLGKYKESAYLAEELYEQYRLVKMKTVVIGDIFIFGQYEQDNDTSNGKEKIEWLVLAKENNKILLISKYALDWQQYNNEFIDITWEKCSLREWLNSTFLNEAFSDEEKVIIKTTGITADKNPEYGTDPGKTTTDKVFLLSRNEVEKYFSSDDTRMCCPTEYAIGRGCDFSISYTKDDKPTCPWWLRSPGSEQYYAIAVNNDGDFILGEVDYYGACVRAAMWIQA